MRLRIKSSKFLLFGVSCAVSQYQSLMSCATSFPSQLETFTSTVFVVVISSVAAIFASVVVAAIIYPFAAILLISLVPIMLSIDHFAKATTRDTRVAQADIKLASKISSVVACRPAVRSCNAGSWVEENVLPLFTLTQSAHYHGFLKSGLIASALEGYVSVYSLFMFVPLGHMILHGTMPVDVYFGLLIPVVSNNLPFFHPFTLLHPHIHFFAPQR